jgi:hypothetical protein
VDTHRHTHTQTHTHTLKQASDCVAVIRNQGVQYKRDISQDQRSEAETISLKFKFEITA